MFKCLEQNSVEEIVAQVFGAGPEEGHHKDGSCRYHTPCPSGLEAGNACLFWSSCCVVREMRYCSSSGVISMPNFLNKSFFLLVSRAERSRISCSHTDRSKSG